MKDRMVLVTAAAGNAAAFQIGLGIGLDRGLPRLGYVSVIAAFDGYDA